MSLALKSHTHFNALYSLKKEPPHFFIRIYLTLYSQQGLKLVWEMEAERLISILIHNFFLTIPYCVIFMTPLSTSSASWSGLLNCSPCGPPPQQVLLSDCRLALTHTAFNWVDTLMGICIYYFITPMTSDKPCDCFRLFTQLRFWFLLIK